jgi:hypothetical protein
VTLSISINLSKNSLYSEYLYLTRFYRISSILRSFRNYNDTRITHPWIQESGGIPTSASLVWSDVSADVVTFPATGTITTENVTIGGASQEIYYLNFDIAQDKIESGNAVVAVKDGAGAVMWSWHLWFAPKEVLNVTTVNSVGFTQEALGLKVPSQMGSKYGSPRSVMLKVKQRESGDEKNITITQNNGSVTLHASTTLYQWGRKDAFPGVAYDDTDVSNNSGKTAKLVYGSFTKNTVGKKSYSYAIQHPGEFITYGIGNYDWHGNDTINTVYNAWAADNTGTSSSYATSSVKKTVYDPCPAGFKMPGSNAFVGLNGTWSSIYSTLYYGRPFTTGSPVFFPAAGCRLYSNGLLYLVGTDGYYWSAGQYGVNHGWGLNFGSGDVYPQGYDGRAGGKSVRPVQE